MTPGNPSTYPRRVLVAVLGLTPQVVTETLYALAVRRDPPFVPTDIVVVTTREGRERVLLTLLDPDAGMLPQLAADYGLEGLTGALTPERIVVITDAAGHPLNDIVADADNAAAADVLTRTIQGLTEDPQAAVHVSIAGGRKTMGFFAGYALSLFGRAQDRLSHVLVSPEFEGHPQFFYPPPRPKVLYTRDNRPIRTDKAEITLADIPFVRLRHGIPRQLLAGVATYAEAVAGVQDVLGPPELNIDLAKRQATAAGQPLPLPPVLLAWIAWFAGRCRSLGADEGALHWSEADSAEFLAAYEAIRGPADPQVERTRQSLANGMTGEYFDEKTARYNKLVRDALGARAVPYLLTQSGRRPRTRTGLRLPPEAIRFAGGAAPMP